MANPFAKFRKKVEEVAPIVEVKPEVKEPEEVKSEPEPVPEPVKEEPKKVEEPEKAPEEAKPEPEPEKVEKPKRPRKTKKAEEKPEPKEEEEAPKIEQAPVPDKKKVFQDFNLMKERLLFDVEDESFNEFKAGIEKKIEDELKISSDINDGSIRILLSTLDEVYQKIRPVKADADAFDEALNGKESGLVTLQKAFNTVGSSAEVRKATGSKACINFELDDKTPVNLFGVSVMFRQRVAWVNSILDIINFKREILRGYLNIMKREG